MSDKLRLTIAAVVTVLFLSATAVAGALWPSHSPTASGTAPTLTAVQPPPPVPQFTTTDAND